MPELNFVTTERTAIILFLFFSHVLKYPQKLCNLTCLDNHIKKLSFSLSQFNQFYLPFNYFLCNKWKNIFLILCATLKNIWGGGEIILGGGEGDGFLLLKLCTIFII